MPETDDVELIDVQRWPTSLRELIDGLRALDSVYELLKIDAPDDMIYHKAMDFLRAARQVRRVEIAAGILSAHSIVLEDDKEPEVPA